VIRVAGMTFGYPEAVATQFRACFGRDPVPRVQKHGEPHDRQQGAINLQPPSGGNHRSGAKPQGWNMFKAGCFEPKRFGNESWDGDARRHVDGGGTTARILVLPGTSRSDESHERRSILRPGLCRQLCRRAKTMEAPSSSSRATVARMRSRARILGTAGNGQDHQESRKSQIPAMHSDRAYNHLIRTSSDATPRPRRFSKRHESRFVSAKPLQVPQYSEGTSTTS